MKLQSRRRWKFDHCSSSMVGFAKALVIAKKLQSLSTLKQSHGIRDVSAGNARIAELYVHVDRDGTFQSFNDVVAPLTRLCYIDNSTKNSTVSLPSASSNKLDELEISLRDILSRIPEAELLRENSSAVRHGGPIACRSVALAEA
ncbi:MAG TPA: hypothetical protein VEM60_03020 [Candidatus Dormibacteraeota bacterium]|nr:hypothetical protein [Candidatus Dormibacteraeota bacterium]